MHWLNSSQRSPGFFSLLVLLAVRGVRYLRRSNEEVQVGGILFDIFKPEVTGLNRGPKITPSVLPDFGTFFTLAFHLSGKPPNLWRSTLLWLKMMRRRLELQHLESWKVAESIQVDVDPYFEGPPKYTEDV